MAINLNLDGAYIPSFNKEVNHLSFSLKKRFLLIGSAHNNKEIKLKEKQGVSILFLSSIFKKNNNYLGFNKFKLLTNLTKKKIIALGGISNKNLKLLKLTNCTGINKNNVYQLSSYCKEIGLNIIGLMCLPPINIDPDNYFEEMKQLNKSLGFSELSMGMSSDFLLAVKHLSTFVRIGSNIFGKRS